MGQAAKDREEATLPASLHPQSICTGKEESKYLHLKRRERSLPALPEALCVTQPSHLCWSKLRPLLPPPPNAFFLACANQQRVFPAIVPHSVHKA